MAPGPRELGAGGHIRMSRSVSAPEGWGEDDMSREMREKGHCYETADHSMRYIRASKLPQELDLSKIVTPTGAPGWSSTPFVIPPKPKTAAPAGAGAGAAGAGFAQKPMPPTPPAASAKPKPGDGQPFNANRY